MPSDYLIYFVAIFGLLELLYFASAMGPRIEQFELAMGLLSKCDTGAWSVLCVLMVTRPSRVGFLAPSLLRSA